MNQRNYLRIDLDLLKCKNLTLLEKAIISEIAFFSVLTKSNKDLSILLGVTEKTIVGAILGLKSKNLIEIKTERKKGCIKSRMITLNQDQLNKVISGPYNELDQIYKKIYNM